LSVVAIKDGAVGHGGRGAASSATTLEAERADRISRLAGLERLSTGRQTSYGNLAPAGGVANPPPGYFDTAVPQVKERSTVGSASATGSVGGRTTWASGSVDYDVDKMSEDQDDGVSSTGGLSDEGNASLVGFGEGASSTISGPISTATARATAARPIPTSRQSGTLMNGVTSSGAFGSTDPKMMDGMSYDANIVDTTMQPAPPLGQQQPVRRFSGLGTDMAESIMRDRLVDTEPARRPMGTPDIQNLGKFPFENE